ncbi:MAG: DUF5808 domain-containing protein [Candidatus Acidiferrales bacterium]
MIRQTNLGSPHTKISLSLILPPFVALGVAATYLHLHWNALPQSFPSHWGINGQPNAWASRDWRGVYGPLLFGATVDGLLVVVAWIGSRVSRKTVMQYATVRSLQLFLYPATLSFILVALLPLVSVPAWVIPTVLLASAAALIYWSYVKVNAAPETERIPKDKWKAGILYWNPEDPAILVPKRFGIGYTINFANKWSWLVMVVLVVIILLPLFFHALR